MVKRNALSKNEKIGKRARHVARQIGGRIYVSENNIYLVTGMPEFDPLFECLNKFKEIPEPEEAPGPIDLGFSIDSLSALTQEKLNTWGQALQKWRQIKDFYEKRNEKNDKVQKWSKEIKKLSALHKGYWKILRSWKNKQNLYGEPYVIVDKKINRYLQSNQNPFQDPLLKWLQHLVIWIADFKAGKQFQKSILPVKDYFFTVMDKKIIEDTIQKLNEYENMMNGKSSRIRDMVIELLENIPQKILHKINMGLPAKDENLTPGKMSKYIKLLTDLKNSQFVFETDHAKFIGTAIFCSLSEDYKPLPQCYPTIKDRTEENYENTYPSPWEILKYFFENLIHQSSKEGFDLLLSELCNFKNLSISCMLEPIRLFLVNREEIEDIDWIIEYVNFPYEAKSILENDYDLKTLHILINKFEDSGVDTDLDDFIIYKDNSDIPCILNFFEEWLSMIGNKSLNKNTAQRTYNFIKNTLNLLDGRFFKDVIKKWLEPELDVNNNLIPDSIPKEAKKWLKKLFYYQELNNENKRITKSIEKLIKPGEKDQKQIDYLESIKGTNEFNKELAERLLLLKKRVKNNDSDIQNNKLVKKIKQVCAYTALNAIENLVKNKIQRLWKKNINVDPPSHLSEAHKIEVTNWVLSLDKKKLSYFNEIIENWNKYGKLYKYYLSNNKIWIEKAEAVGINIKEWLSPECKEIKINNTTIKISISPDPFYTFLMGNYFGTCISINRRRSSSVLLNAYDANKAVLFALDKKNNVLARKLVGINQKYEMIGYKIYTKGEEVINDNIKEKLNQVIEGFCIEWANKLNIKPGYKGKPSQILPGKWYNDGTVGWNNVIKRAITRPDLSLVRYLNTNSIELLPKISSMITLYNKEVIELLDSYGIVPLEILNDTTKLGEYPTLLEESLAIIARMENNIEMARTLYNCSVTDSGIMEAFTSLTLILKNDFLSEIKEVAQNHKEWRERIFELLYDIDSKHADSIYFETTYSKVRGYWPDEEFISYSTDAYWRNVFASKSKFTSEEYIRNMIEEFSELNIYNSNNLACLIEEFKIQNWNVPSYFILSSYNIASVVNRDGVFPIPQLVEWLPCIPNYIDREILHEVYEKNQRAAITLALKNKGPDSKSFLKEKAEESSQALLALAIISGRRFQEYIINKALKNPVDKIVILALIVSQGKQNALEILNPTLNSYPNQKDRLENVCKLYDTYRLHNFNVSDDIFLIGAFPLLLNYLWKWVNVENPDVNAIRDLFSAESLRQILEWNEIWQFGLAIRLAALLRKDTGDNHLILQEACLICAGECIEFPDIKVTPECKIFLLDKLSNYKLFNKVDPKSNNHKKLRNVENSSYFRNKSIDDEISKNKIIFQFLFNKRGKIRPIVKFLDWEKVDTIKLPYKLEDTVKMIRYIKEKCEAENIVKKFDMDTEIQKRLIINIFDVNEEDLSDNDRDSIKN